MDANDAFLAGFLLKCAEEGLSLDEAFARADEAIQLKEAGMLETAVGGLGSIASGGLGSAVATGIGGGALAGGLYAMATPEDPLKGRRHPYLDELERADLISAFHTDSQTLQRQLEAIKRRQLRTQAAKKNQFGI